MAVNERQHGNEKTLALPQVPSPTVKINRKIPLAFYNILDSKPMHACELSPVQLIDTPRIAACARLLCPWDSPGKSTGVVCHALLQGIFLTQGLDPHLLRLPALAGMFFTTIGDLRCANFITLINSSSSIGALFPKAKDSRRDWSDSMKSFSLANSSVKYHYYLTDKATEAWRN